MKKIKSIFTLLVSNLFLFIMSLKANAAEKGWSAGMGIINDPTEVTLPGGDYGPGPVWILLSSFLWLLKIFIILAVISFVIAGITFLVSTINPNLRERAKDGVTYSIIAIIVAFAGILVLATVLAILSGGAFLDYFL